MHLEYPPFERPPATLSAADRLTQMTHSQFPAAMKKDVDALKALMKQAGIKLTRLRLRPAGRPQPRAEPAGRKRGPPPSSRPPRGRFAPRGCRHLPLRRLPARSGKQTHLMTSPKPITIARVGANFEREPLVRPFGFKGGYQTGNLAERRAAPKRSGPARPRALHEGRAVERCARVCRPFRERRQRAHVRRDRVGVQQLKGQTFTDPVALLDRSATTSSPTRKKSRATRPARNLRPQRARGRRFRRLAALRRGKRHHERFDDLIPAAYRPALAHRHAKIASIPLMAYAVPIPRTQAAVEAGYFFMKIKIGQPGTQAEMLEKDKARISAIHAAIGDARTPYTANGKLPYYFDANGRYESKDTLLRLLDHTRAIGAFDQIALIEEPFPEELEIDISDIPARVAADESAHTDRDALKRIQMGYKAIALKPIAKTFSMSLKIAQLAHERGVPCFCADLTVSPLLVEWNKNVAARLAPFPGLGLGLVETNGHQNYRNWDTMRGYHPAPDAPWARTQRGVFELDADYYAQQRRRLPTLAALRGDVFPLIARSGNRQVFARTKRSRVPRRFKS
jgi:hypothetical protein